MVTKRPRRVSKRQLEFLEYLIWKSKDADEFSKKCLIWLIRHSQGLTKAVRIADLNIPNIVSNDFHDMVSCNGTTHINEVLRVAGSSLAVDYGGAAIYDDETPWKVVTILSTTKREINAIIPTDPYED